MRGTMLWFNHAKQLGFIRTEDGERLPVGLDAFLPGQLPGERCAGVEVVFERQDGPEEPCAVNVVRPDSVEPRRARLRHSRGGRSL
jgi:cold shock CspA family protein